MNIIQTPQGYRATIDGTEWSIPNDPGNRFWQMVQDAIADGAQVTIEEPPAAPVPESMTFAQLLIGLVTEQWIMQVEGEAWLQGVLPQQVTGLIGTLPQAQQFPAKARASRPSVILRNDPLVVAMGAAQGKTPAEIDTFFQTYAGV
jgi:hypothetical protein